MANRHHINYTYADIRRYYEGQMSPAERHALEAAALEDPFLADAVDGYANAPTAGTELQESVAGS